MTWSNEATPEEVPSSHDWANGPTASLGNNPDGWQAITAWGVVYGSADPPLRIIPGSNVNIGHGAKIFCKGDALRIGDGATIGACAVAFQDVTPICSLSASRSDAGPIERINKPLLALQARGIVSNKPEITPLSSKQS